MAVREIDPHWQSVHRALLNKIAYREREIMEMHDEIIDWQYRYSALMSVIMRQARKDRFERDNRMAKEASDA